MNARTNTITPPALTPRKYDTIGAISSELDTHIEFNAPDYKSCVKALDTTVECIEGHDPDAAHTDALLDTLYNLGGAFEGLADRAHYKAKGQDTLYNLGGAFEGLADRAHYKAKGQDTPQYVRHTKRATFYRQIADWAEASFNLIDGHQSPPAKDAEDDSDPYITTTPLYGPHPPAPRPLNDTWQKIASTLKMRYDNNLIARAKIEFDRAVGTVWSASGTGDDPCRILELFGDACANIDYAAPTNEKFWGACVLISDDLRATIAAENIKVRSTYTQPAPPTPMPLVSTRSEEFVTAGVMWEVAGDVSRSLCRTKMDAEAWARVLFPSELVDKRYARIQSRTIIAK